MFGRSGPRKGVGHARNELVAHGDIECGVGRNDGVKARSAVQKLVVGNGDGGEFVLHALLTLQGVVQTAAP